MLQYLKTLKLHIVPYSLLHKKCVIYIFWQWLIFIVGNLLFGFSCKSLAFCECKSEIAICSFPRGYCSCSCCSLKKSNWSEELRIKEWRQQFARGHTNGKSSEKLPKNMVKTTYLFEKIARFLRAKERIPDPAYFA